MELSGEHTVPASREATYDAMLDPQVLKDALPGCEKLEEVGPNEYIATMTIGVAMIKGTYEGRVRIADENRPESFTMHVDGKGPQGQLSGVGHLTFEKIDDETTLVRYTGEANVRGMLARIGSRVIQPAAKMIVGRFFEEMTRSLKRA